MRMNLLSPALVLLTLTLAFPSRGSAAAVLERSRSRIATTLSLGGGVEAGSTSNGLGEFELTVGYEVGDVRPELGVVLGLAPNDHAALRPGVHVALARLPAYGRAALDFSTERDGWKFRWVLLGVGTETRVTSEMGAFAEADVGLPMGSEFGLALLARAGFSLRF
jgi:hypothetical protein